MNPILVVYYSREYPMRMAVFDHLYSFRRHAGRPCYYLNLAERRPGKHLAHMGFDLIIFHTTFLSPRWNLAHFRQLVDRARPLRDLGGIKIALPQDEFLQTDAVCTFLQEFGVTHVFSVMPESEWPTIYPGIDRARVKFLRVLTGYLEEETLARIERLAAAVPSRDIDIGYRAWRAAPWLGRHGVLKADLAEVFQRRAVQTGLRVDISTRDNAVLRGDSWYEFLLRCKYTLGVEGGASILDRDGTIRTRTEAFLERNPGASFVEIEQACFPGLDGSANLVAISPRHLEACVTRTCQVLVEGGYNGILKPGAHYIELKRDFSNMAEVLDLVKQDTLREELTDLAYRDIVTSGAYTYWHFVKLVLDNTLSSAVDPGARVGVAGIWLFGRWGAVADRASWVRVALRCRWRAFIERLPLPVRRVLRQMRQALRGFRRGFRFA